VIPVRPRSPGSDPRVPVIRSARPGEVEAIVEVWAVAELVSDRHAAPKELRRLLGNELRDRATGGLTTGALTTGGLTTGGLTTDLLLVAVVDDLVVATVLGTWDGRRGWVQRLAARPEWRGWGVATDLMAEVERRLRAIGCTKVNLLVEPANREVVGFYERLGFRTDELIFMEKWL
jgi:ribosomal protein S18 acetylase RimI-like enzyme